MAKNPHPIDVHVGSRVRMRRMLIHMSQEKLGEHLGLTFQQVQKYEKGANRIGSSRLFQISQILNIPIKFFFDDVPSEFRANLSSGTDSQKNENSVESLMKFVATRDALDLNISFQKIEKAETRRAIVDLVRVI